MNSLVRCHGQRFPHLTHVYSYTPFSRVTCKSSEEQGSHHFNKPYQSTGTPVHEGNLFKLTNSWSHFNPNIECLDYSMFLGSGLGFLDYHSDTALQASLPTSAGLEMDDCAFSSPLLTHTGLDCLWEPAPLSPLSPAHTPQPSYEFTQQHVNPRPHGSGMPPDWK